MEDSEVLVWFTVWVIFGGGVGAAIGSSKGRGGTGFILGLVLGFIGWIIVAVMDPTPEKMAETHQRIGAIAGVTGVVQRPAAQQWAPDPYGRHDHRLFDGELWTQRVSDAGQQSIDEPGYPCQGLQTRDGLRIPSVGFPSGTTGTRSGRATWPATARPTPIQRHTLGHLSPHHRHRHLSRAPRRASA